MDNELRAEIMRGVKDVPVALVRNLPGQDADLTIDQLRALARALNQLADECEEPISLIRSKNQRIYDVSGRCPYEGQQVRIEWLIDGQRGHGEWHDSSTTHLNSFKSSIRSLNEKYGPGTHWLGCSQAGVVNFVGRRGQVVGIDLFSPGPTFNGSSVVLNCFDHAPASEVVALLAKWANITLTDVQETVALKIIEHLPKRPSIRNFIESRNILSAEALGVSLTEFESIFPLLDALKPFIQEGLYAHLFEGGGCSVILNGPSAEETKEGN